MTTKHRGVIVLSPKLQVSEEDLDRLRDAGYVPLIGQPAHVKLLSTLGEIDGNVLTLAALKTCNVNDARQKEFGQLVLRSLIAEAEATP